MVPAPGVELGPAACAQVDVGVPAGQAQQEPDLLLAAVMAAPLASNPVLRYLVSQPLTGSAEHADMVGKQPDLFTQLTIHRLLGRLAAVDSPLRKLPGMLANPFAPEHLVSGIHEDDADIGAISVPVQHGRTR